MSNEKRAGIVITGEDKSAPAFASLSRNMQAAHLQARELGDKVEGFAGKFGTIGLALTAAFAGASLKGVIDVGDELSKLSEKTGISVQELSALRYAGELAGVPLEALSTGMKKLAVTMTDAAGGAKEQSAVFQALGINLKNTDGSLKSSGVVLGELADKFQSFEDGPAKAALAVKIFGKAGTDMIPMLNQGSAGLAEMRGEAEKLGVVFSGELAKASEAFNDNIRKIEFSAEGGKRVMAQELLPTMNTLAAMFLETRDNSGSLAETLGGGVRTALEAASILFANVAFTLKGVGREIGAIAAQAIALASLDLDGFHAISDAVKEDGVRARKELDDLEQRILSFGAKNAGAGRGTAPDPRALGPIASIREQTRGWKQQAPVIDKTDGTETQSVYDKLSASIKERNNLMDKELELHRSLTEQEKFESKILSEVAAAGKKISAEKAASIKLDLEASRAKNLQLEIERSQLKAAQETATERAKQRTADNQSVNEWLQEQQRAANESLKAVRDRVQSVSDETKAADMAVTANISLAEAVEKVTIARLQEKLATVTEDGTEAERIRNEIAERLRLLDVLRHQRISEGWRDEIKAGKEDAKRLFSDIYQGLSDSLMRGFEAGKNFFSSFWNGVKNTIKTTVLRVGIQGLLSATPFAAAAGQAGAGGLGSALSTASGVGSLGTLATGAGAFSGGVMSGLTAWGEGGSVMGLLGSGSSLFAGGIMNGIGLIAGALGPIAIGVGLLMAFMKKGGGPKADGRSGTVYTDIGTFDNSLAAGLKPAVGGLQTQYGALAKQFGGEAAVSFGLAISRDPKGTAPTFLEIAGTKNGQQLFSNLNRNVGRSDEDLQAAIGVATTDALLGALKASNLEKPFADFFNSVAADATQEAKNAAIDTASTVAQYTKPLEDLRGVFAQLSSVSVEARASMIEAAGGLQALTDATNAYYQNFYSDTERRDITIGRISTGLADIGLSLKGVDLNAGSARATFRQWVNALDLSTEEGRKAYTVLIGLSGAFASVTPAIDAAGNALAGLIDPLQALKTARDDLQTAYDNEQKALESTRDRMDGFVAKFKSFRDSLVLSDLSPLTPKQRYSEARAQFNSTVADMQSPDQSVAGAAMESFDAVARSFLEASREYNASGAGYQADFAMVMAQTNKGTSIAQQQYDAARESLTRLDAMVSGLIDVKGAVLTVAEAIHALGSLNSPAGQGDLTKLYSSMLGRAPDQGGLDYWNAQMASGMSIDTIGGFFKGSDEYKRLHGVPLASGLDYVPYDNFAARLHLGEAVLTKDEASLWRGGQSNAANDALVGEVRALRQCVEQLRAESGRDAERVVQVTASAGDRTAAAVERGVEAASRNQFQAESARKAGAR